MGYFTYFTLNKISGSDEDYNALIGDIREKTGYDFSNDTVVEGKWYDCDEDMTELSKKYPDLIVQMDGDGENSDDIWASRYHNGERESKGFEMLPFCRIATREERMKFLQDTFKGARKNFLDLIRIVVEENGRDMAVRIELQDHAIAKEYCNRVWIQENELWFNRTFESDKTIQPLRNDDGRLDTDLKISGLLKVALGLFKKTN